MASCDGSKTVSWSLSMISVGATRPPAPNTVGVMTPVPILVTVGDTISVIVRLVAAPLRNSSTVPITCTLSPTSTVGALEVNTKMPSDVATLPSPTASCIQKPLVSTAVTTPSVFTCWSSYAERWPAPWIS